MGWEVVSRDDFVLALAPKMDGVDPEDTGSRLECMYMSSSTLPKDL